MKHTQGEWTTEIVNTNLYAGNLVFSKKNKQLIADCNITNMRDKEAEANAKLIAAAPMMLKALEMIRDFDDDSDYGDPGEIAIEAIKKATT